MPPAFATGGIRLRRLVLWDNCRWARASFDAPAPL